VVVDLEDAVGPDRKEQARRLAVEALAGDRDRESLAMLRINSAGTAWFADDIAALPDLYAELDVVVLAKAESAAVERVDHALNAIERDHGKAPRLLPIVETAVGVQAVDEIAKASARIQTLLFGSADLCTDLGLVPTDLGSELAYARSRVVVAAAAAGLGRPIDGPYLRLGDDEGLARSAREGRRLGFGGKAVIHPEQLAIVDSAFSWTAEELEWAASVDHAFAESERRGVAVTLLADGSFVDLAVALRARAMLADARSDGTGHTS
jgi:citrate lyase subunit beta/citryl-CoA lyase